MNARDRDEEDDRFTASLAGLALALLLAIVALFLIDRLATVSKLEDCLLQGRKNCKRIELSAGQRDYRQPAQPGQRSAGSAPRQAADMMR
jgi:hypothetical protein